MRAPGRAAFASHACDRMLCARPLRPADAPHSVRDAVCAVCGARRRRRGTNLPVPSGHARRTDAPRSHQARAHQSVSRPSHPPAAAPLALSTYRSAHRAPSATSPAAGARASLPSPRPQPAATARLCNPRARPAVCVFHAMCSVCACCVSRAMSSAPSTSSGTLEPAARRAVGSPTAGAVVRSGRQPIAILPSGF
jgi:hypothetical protein